MQNPDPRRYREAEIALEFDEATFREFVRQGRLYGWLKHWDPRRGWHVVEPYLLWAEVERVAAPDYACEQDADPRANTDCSTASSQARVVRAAEFQAFAQ